MSDREWFGEVRSAAHGEASASGWGRICRALDRMSEAFGRGQALPYLDGALAGWPDGTRRAPIRWLREASAKGKGWRLGAARAVSLDLNVILSLSRFGGEELDDEAERRKAHVAALLACEDMRGVRAVEMSAGSFASTFDYASSPLFDGLASLSLIGRAGWRSDDLGRVGLEALFASGLDELEHVEVEWSPFSDARLCELLGELPRLRSLARAPRARDLRLCEESFGLEHLERAVMSWGDVRWPEGALPKLRELDLCVGAYGARLKRWGEWGGWSRLESFTLRGDYNDTNWRDDSAGVRANVNALVDALAGAEALERLSIRVTLRPEDLQRVLALESLSSLKVLNLEHAHSKGVVGRATFMDIASRRGVEELRLNDCAVTKSLAGKLTYPPGVRRLDLSGKNKLGEGGARQVAECEDVEVAWLERVGLGPEGGVALASGGFGQSVRALDVSANKLGARGLEGLLSRGWPRLESLWLGMNGTGNELDADAMRLLADWEGLANLRFLSLTSARLSGEAMEVLCSSPNLQRLEVLDVSGNEMTALAAESLAQAPCARTLRALGVGFTGLSRSTSGWDAFAEGDWGALELLYFTDEELRVGSYEQITRSLRRFPALEMFDAGSKIVPFLDSRARREDASDYGFSEDGVFPYALVTVGYRGITQVHSASWLEPTDADARESWWDVVSR